MYVQVTWKMSPAASNRYEIIVTNPIYYRPNDFNFFFCLPCNINATRPDKVGVVANNISHARVNLMRIPNRNVHKT